METKRTAGRNTSESVRRSYSRIVKEQKHYNFLSFLILLYMCSVFNEYYEDQID